MPGTHEPLDDRELPSPDRDDRNDSEPGEGADGREHRVARRLPPLPVREAEEQELAEADLFHELELDDIDLDTFEPDEL